MGTADGNGWVTCRCGRRHWGRFGAAGLLVVQAGHVLLQLRAPWVHEPDTWALPGGAKDSHETSSEAATREAHEEVGINPEALRSVATIRTTEHHDWHYDVHIAALTRPTELIPNEETAAASWFAPDQVPTLPLHPGFAASWPEVSEHVPRTR